MNVVVFVGPACLTRLQSGLSGGYAVHDVASLDDFQRELDAGAAEVGVIDLDSCREANMTVLIRIVSHHGPALIAYGVFAPRLVRTIARLARHGLCHMIFRGVDDSPSSLRCAVRDAAATKLGAEIVVRVLPMLSHVSPPVRDAIAQLFGDPLRFQSAADIAHVAGITRRSLDRTLHAADLEPARTFLLAARVTWAYPRMRSAHTTVSDVSRQLGVSKPERFSQHTRLLLGLPPSALRTQLSPDQFVEMIVGRLRRQARSVRAPTSNLPLPISSWSREQVLTADGVASA